MSARVRWPWAPLVLRAVQECVEDWGDARFILADLISDDEPDHACRLRFSGELPVLLPILDLGCWLAGVVATQCRAAVRRYTRHVWHRRVQGEALPEYRVRMDGSMMPSLREQEGFRRDLFGPVVIPDGDFDPDSVLRLAHVQRLVQAGLMGRSVPGDVGTALSTVRASCRSIILQGRRWYIHEKPR